MTSPRLIIHPNSDLLAKAAAARLLTALIDATSDGREAHLVVTGGGIGTAVLAALAEAPARDAVAWPSIHVWWGDERFLPHAHPDRNETGARRALLDHVPLEGGHVHPMPSAEDATADAAEAARAYAAELSQYAAAGQQHPTFDVLLLGVGEDGHVASLFPGRPVGDDELVIAVYDAPKPPPTRLSLTLKTINTAEEIWLLAGGEEKADAVRRAWTEGDVPAALVRGRRRTLWLVDQAAAGRLADQKMRG